ncbi:MAG: hypothetical protein H0U75_05095 [Legionella sp.]|nr:hypothetical protein [Legionella sp.]
MKCINKIATIGLIAFSLPATAGFWGPTAHSRANCAGFNESVTWHAGHSYFWRVKGLHYPYGWLKPAHILDTGKAFTWRAAVLHATEAYSSRGDRWTVAGYHFWYPNGKELVDVITTATDCAIYDGWWDQ